MAYKVLKQTETLAIVKVWGTNTTDIIHLATDLLSPTMVISGTPTVNITGFTYGCSPGGQDQVEVSRNGVPIANLYQNGQIDLGGEWGISDDIGNTDDITVHMNGQGFIYINLRKVAGYKSKIEPETFGPYDNTTVVGA